MTNHPYLKILEKEINEYPFPKTPQNLYEPLSYFLNIGGKRLRPLLTILGCRLFNGDESAAVKPALAIELFHNFSLIHDDIMDQAPKRRGVPTIHKKWNENIAILSGDALLVEAYKMVAQVSPDVLPDVLQVFSNTATLVCEGQQYDMDFETQDRVSQEEYIDMIQKKTSVLLGCALEIGALVAKADKKDAERLYQFGLNLGTAFQIKDDYLDAFGDPEKFGKQVGGDILCNKKTLLLLRLLEVVGEEDKVQLHNYLATSNPNNLEKVEAVKALYKKWEVDCYAIETMNSYYNSALLNLNEISVNSDRKAELSLFAEWLHKRDM